MRETVEKLQRDGKPVRYLGSTIVPADESFLCVLEAASEDLVRYVYAQAGIPFERISTALPEGARQTRPASKSEPRVRG